MSVLVKSRQLIEERHMSLSGFVNGLLAGVVMLTILMIRGDFSEMTAWYYPEMMASLIFGIEAFILDTRVFLLGILLHFVISALAGVLYGLLFGHLVNWPRTLLAGVLFGGAVWAIGNFFILPWLSPAMLTRVQMDFPWWLLAHISFGATFGLLPLIEKYFTPRINPFTISGFRRAYALKKQRDQGLK